jgi:hypothetical protein
LKTPAKNTGAIMNQTQPICEACGQPVLIRSELPPLTPIQQAIFDIVRKRPGVSAERLRSLVWGASGGPESRSAIFVHVSGLNKRLAPLGVMIRSQGGGYQIVRAEAQSC